MKSTPVKPSPSWEERFGWYHYDGTAIYSYTQADLDRVARTYYDNGITAVILFGAHFRFSFWAYWEDIEDFITRLTQAFHKKGIKVIEHHSTHLTYKPLEESYWEKRLKPGEQFYSYPDFRETSQSNPVLGGENHKARLDDFAQIDGSTGKPALSSYVHTEGKDVYWIFKHYNGHAHCFNHPAFEEAYWGHVKNIIQKSGIDGMMNDDVQWFGGGNACACEYCREKFKQETGYDLPSPDNWNEFFEDYDNPAYIAWKKFKKKQSGDFHRRMDERYKSIGFYPIRPAYCAEVLPFDTTCYGFEAARELWDYIFQECCGIIKHSYICFATEAVHRYAMAKRHNVPSMAMLYPSTPDSTYASWALCRSWGQLYTGTGGDITKLFDRPYREFEKKHKSLYENPEKVSDLAFYFSETTRDYTDKDAPQKYMKPYMSYLESAYVSNISCDMVFRYDTVEELSKHKIIVLPYIVMISESEGEKLRKYAEKGGTLLVLGCFGEKDDDGRKRTPEESLGLLGLKSKALYNEYIGFERVNGITFDHALSRVIIEKPEGEVIATGKDGAVLGVSEKVGKGRVIYHPSDVSFHPIQPAVWTKGLRTPVDRSFVGEMREFNGKLLESFIGKKTVDTDNPDILASVFKAGDGCTLHLVNTKGFLPEEDTDASRTDPIPPFCEGATKLDGFRVTLKSIDTTKFSAFLYSPEVEEGIPLNYEVGDGVTTLDIPSGVFSGYAVIRLESR